MQVSGARELRVDEIIARHQAASARQGTAIATIISSGESVLSVQVPGFAGPLTITARTTNYASPATTEVEEQDIRINGLDLRPAPGKVPRLPIVEPERVSTPPLTIALTDSYRYALRGRARINGRPAYIVSFEPLASGEPAVAGQAWIDAATFGIAKLDAVQRSLRGPIVSSRQIDRFELLDYRGTPVSLLRHSEVFQVYPGPADQHPFTAS